MIKYNIMKFMLDYKLERLPLSFSETWIQDHQRGIYALRNAEDFLYQMFDVYILGDFKWGQKK